MGEFWGKEEKIQAFYEETNSIKFPYDRVEGPDFFADYEWEDAIDFAIGNGVVKGQYGYRTIEYGILGFME